MGLEMDTGFEALADCVQEVGERGVEGGLGGMGAKGVRSTHCSDVLLNGVGWGKRHKLMIAWSCHEVGGLSTSRRSAASNSRNARSGK
jgi:hypothetical protein